LYHPCFVLYTLKNKERDESCFYLPKINETGKNISKRGGETLKKRRGTRNRKKKLRMAAGDNLPQTHC
jgi:hypothetical protein